MSRPQIAALLDVTPSVATNVAGAGGWRFPIKVRPAEEIKGQGSREYRESRINGHTYAELHAAVMGASEAARMRGERSPDHAWRWAEDHGLKWTDGRTTASLKEKYRANAHRGAEKRLAAHREMLKDPARFHKAHLTDEQRADYEFLMQSKGLDSATVAQFVGVPKANIHHPRRHQTHQKRRDAIRRDPEAAMLAAIRQQQVRK
ncbi:hypothetical protein [Paracoccus sp. R86501]|uniref:hypothetical protein n=1 Tax=Paracoccus sp. R86501 TaxID=3101711 RepID=UPI00366F36E6